MAIQRVYQFKITLRDIDPAVWRRILVPESFTFWDLHVAVQDAMGWQDKHLHVFQMKKKHARSFAKIGIPMDDGFEDADPPLPGWDTPLARFFLDVGGNCLYEYDFGDGWRHDLLLEGILLREKGRKYPVCLDGARRCPPEDCGGVFGYLDCLEAVADPNHEEHEDLIEWLGDGFDPEEFDLSRVKFSNPRTRLRESLGIG